MWIFSLIFNSLFARRKQNASLLIIIGGVSVGVFSLIVVLGMMNGLQDVLIKNLIAIESYDYSAVAPKGLTRNEIQALAEQIQEDEKIICAVPFIDEFSLAQAHTKTAVLHVRIIDAFFARNDTSLIEALSVSSRGQKRADDFLVADGIVLGWQSALQLGVRVGDVLTLSFLGEGTGFSSIKYDLVISDIFYSGEDAYDTRWAFMSFNDYMRAMRSTNFRSQLHENASTQKTIMSNVHFGIRMHPNARSRHIHTVIDNLRTQFQFDTIQSWKERNRAFYFALKTEKGVLIVLVGIIFCIIALHCRFVMIRRIHSKRDDIVSLRAMGASPKIIRMWFLGESVFVGLVGIMFGVVFGILFLSTYNDIVLFFSKVVYFPVPSDHLKQGDISAQQLIKIICFTGFMLIGTAFIATQKVARIAPMQVLRYD